MLCWLVGVWVGVWCVLEPRLIGKDLCLSQPCYTSPSYTWGEWPPTCVGVLVGCVGTLGCKGGGVHVVVLCAKHASLGGASLKYAHGGCFAAPTHGPSLPPKRATLATMFVSIVVMSGANVGA